MTTAAQTAFLFTYGSPPPTSKKGNDHCLFWKMEGGHRLPSAFIRQTGGCMQCML